MKNVAILFAVLFAIYACNPTEKESDRQLIKNLEQLK